MSGFSLKRLLVFALFFPVVLASCGLVPQSMRNMLDKGAETVLAGRIRSGKQIVSGEKLLPDEAAAVNTAPPAALSVRRAGSALSTGQERIPTAARVVTGTAVLKKGNSWTTRIPGVGENVFPAFYGEYILEPKTPSAAAGKQDEKSFSVYASREALFFPETEWQPRPGISLVLPEALWDEKHPGITDYSVFQRQEDSNLVLALVLDRESALNEVWRIVFCYPGGNTGLNLSNAQLNRLTSEWVDWFLYFFAPVQDKGEISFPGVVNF
jgi:hypothetical protein